MRGSAFVALLCMAAAEAAAATLVDRGRTIYHRGEGRSEIVARLGEARLPASAVPCASCHGPDGRGKREGGVTPPDLRHGVLTKPYSVAAGGRTRAPYDNRLLRRAITEGIDPSGNALSKVMPRYRLSRGDLDALVAFLGTLGDEVVPGVTDHSIRAGVFLPPDQRAESVRRAIESWVSETNASGGVYGRSLEVRFASAPPREAERAGALAKFIRDEGLFALFASFTDGAEKAAGFVPLLSAFSDDPDPRAHGVRYLLAGIPQQARALARLAAESGTSLPVAVIRASDAPAIAARAAEAFAAEARAAGFQVVDGAGGLRPLAAVLLLGNATPPKDVPLVLSIASLGGAAAFDGTRAMAQAVAFPIAPTRDFARSAAIASATVFVEALRAVGVDLTRERFLEAVDAERGIGARSVWIVSVDGSGRVADQPRVIVVNE